MATKSQALHTPVYSTLPPGAVRPAGWLERQLRLQAEGITGQLEEFWPDVADSGWIGGNAEGWERGPYWLDGAVGLAFQLQNAKLLEKVTRWVNYIVEHQHEDGWLGPVRSPNGRYRAYDPWPVFVTLKALTQYQEATGDERIIPMMERFLRRLQSLIAEQPLFDWGKMRWADLVLSIHWLYWRTEQPWLLDLAAQVQAQGFDWIAHFNSFPYKKKTPREQCNLINHVVNNAMAIKTPGVWYTQSQNPADRQAVYTAINMLEKYHGQVTGVFSGDEHLAGRAPSQGTELCAVVEYMFSLEYLISTLGDPVLADRLEKIAYNALPGTFTPDMWAHQYDQQANQVSCTIGKHVWTNNHDDSNIFGLEPNFGCCTANLHQGWPKFTAHLWMQGPDNALVAAAYAPCEVTTKLESGQQVTITETTDYPFDGSVQMQFHTTEPVAFPLVVRIPGWAAGATITIGSSTNQAAPGTFSTLNRTWNNGDMVTLQFPQMVRCEERFNRSVALWRGPLVYSLRIGEDFREVKAFGPGRDYEITPTTAWNYGLQLDCAHPENSIRVERNPIPPCPFDPTSPPVVIKATGWQVEWGLEPGYNDAAPPPQNPQVTGTVPEEIVLIPYGSAHLRITEFPLIFKA